MKLKTYCISLLLFLSLINSGCKKYLEAKSNDALVVISNLRDLQSLLDNYTAINGNGPSADEASTDEYYLTYDVYQALSYVEFRNMYIWAPKNLFFPYTNTTNDWNQTYNKVYIANTVLDNMNKVERTMNASTWDNIKGQALFLRSFTFYKIANIWALAYDESTAKSDLGIPLRLNSNFNEQSKRSSVADTYNQIITDTKLVVQLLTTAPVHVYRSAKPAAYALLAQTYLSMRKYDIAKLYADSCLQLHSTLIDYNTINDSQTYPISQFNREIIYDTSNGGQGGAIISGSRAKINESLYSSYASNDLRKTLFFAKNPDNSIRFRGSYEGSSSLFNGIAADEIYLIRAECLARAGNTIAALSDLNALLKNRYDKTFIPITASNSADALAKILIERQKELIMRGTRWIDIKRLNKDGTNINLTRVLNGVIYTLPANDLRFALPIPEDVISLSGMQQNPR